MCNDGTLLEAHRSSAYHQLVLGAAVLALTTVRNGLTAVVALLAILQVVDGLSRNTTDLRGSRGELQGGRRDLGGLTHDRGSAQSLDGSEMSLIDVRNGLLDVVAFVPS